MKNNNNIQSFREFKENLNISDVSDSENNLKIQLSKNQDWNIEIQNKKTGDKLVICNYYSATSNQPRMPKNYPVEDSNNWLSYDDIVNNYIFVKSWTPDDKVKHINYFKNYFNYH
jgi:hypothetical protein